MSELRIALIASQYWPSIEQHARVLGQLAPGLAAAGAKVTVVTPQHNARWPIGARHKGVQIVRLRKGARNADAARGIGRRRLARWLKGHASSVDVVLVSGLKAAAATCVKATRSLGLPVVLRAESAGIAGDCHWQIESRSGQRIKKWCAKAEGTIAPNPIVHDELIAAGYPRMQIHLCQTGVQVQPYDDIAARHRARAAIAEAHPGLHLADHAPLVVSIGHQTREQNAALLIDCWPAVVERFPGARLWLIGDGPQRVQLQAKADMQVVSGSIAFPGSFNEVEELLQAADVLVWPGRDADPPYEQFEAMAAARPIVLADSPAARSLMKPDESALFVTGKRPADWAQTICELLAQPDRAAGFGRRARARAVECFSFSHMIESHLAVLRQIVGE